MKHRAASFRQQSYLSSREITTLINTISFTTTATGEARCCVCVVICVYDDVCNFVKATFHYSSKLQTWLQTWLSTCVSVSKARRKQVESMSKACRKPARTCRKPGCKPGRKPGLQPGLQLARILECSLNHITLGDTVTLYQLSSLIFQTRRAEVLG